MGAKATIVVASSKALLLQLIALQAQRSHIVWIQLDSNNTDSYKRALLTRNMLIQDHAHVQYSNTPTHCSTEQTNYTLRRLLDKHSAVD